MTGKEVAQRVIEHIENARKQENSWDYIKIGRYIPETTGSWKNIPAGHAWISNFDVESLWDNKDLPNLKPQCKKIIEVLEKWLSGQTNKEINKVGNKKPKVVVDLNNYYKVGDVVMLALDGWAKDRYDFMLFRIEKVGKTFAYVSPIIHETNVDEVLQNIKYYGESATWYRKYKKEELTEVMPFYCKKVTAKELGVSSFKGKIHDDSVAYTKFYDAESGNILMKNYDCDDIVINNDKYWYD